jgi:hypothetical protein
MPPGVERLPLMLCTMILTPICVGYVQDQVGSTVTETVTEGGGE